MTLKFLIDEGLELDDNSEDSEDSTEEQRPCIDPLCGWSRRQGCILRVRFRNFKPVFQ